MRNTFILTVVLIVVFTALRLAGVITSGWFLGLGVVLVVLGVVILFVMAGVMEGEWQLQLGGLLLTVGIVLVIVGWILG